MKIAVCVKVAPNPDQYNLIRLDPETKTLVREGVDSVISSTDLHSIEAAIQIKEKLGGTITLISMGPPSNEKQLREGLSYGCDDAVLVSDRALGGADALATSYTLAKAIEKCGGFDLVLLGNASDDGSTAHVPSQLGEWLGLPHITDVISLEVSEGSVLAAKELDGGVNTYKVALPTVIGVTKRVNKVRHPSVMGIFSAKKKPMITLTAADLDGLDESRIGLAGSPTQAEGYHEASFGRECVEIEGSEVEKSAEVVRVLNSYLKH